MSAIVQSQYLDCVGMTGYLAKCRNEGICGTFKTGVPFRWLEVECVRLSLSHRSGNAGSAA